jgi:hypothetical protein
MNPDYLRVEGHMNLLRDPNTNSIINLNMSEYQQYIARKNVKSEENKKIQNLEDDVANIKDDLDEIKSLLRSLVNGS